jgi:hypothetical protein
VQGSLEVRGRPSREMDGPAQAANVVSIRGASLTLLDSLPPNLIELFNVIVGYAYLDEPEAFLFSLAAATSSGLEDEPLWGMLVGPPSSGKTESVAVVDLVAHDRVAELTAAGLLSWAKVGRAGTKTVQSGLLTRIPNPAFVTISDFSTILASSNRGLREELFSLIRHVYDGQVSRHLGNSLHPLKWEGRVTFLAACTPAIDRYSSHSDALGPRWLYFRLRARSDEGKRHLSRKIRSEGRAELRREAQKLVVPIVGDAIALARTIEIDDQLSEALEDAALVTCRGRAAVPRDGYGRREIIDMPVVEEPPRVLGQIRMLSRSLLGLGLDRQSVLAVARRAASDSMPAARRGVLLELSGEDGLTAAEIARRAGCDRKVALFALEELECVRVVERERSWSSSRSDDGHFTGRPWHLSQEYAGLVRAVFLT